MNEKVPSGQWQVAREDGGLKTAIERNAAVKPNSELLETLKSSVPQFFDSEGNFKADKFTDEIKANNIAEARDGYRLGFVGKDYARLQTGRASETVIVPDCKHNALPENKDSDNVFITGDNIEALRHLVNAYENAIKLIYIDPPYNTGKEFVYSDKFEFDDEKLQSALGYTPQEVARLKSIQGKSSHSAWLTFMYPRLKIAQKLLTPDGVIFVSIDDNEQANLKLLMDDVFGEGNFVACLNWNTKKAAQGMTTENMIVDNHEYIFTYAKKTGLFRFFGLERDSENGFANPDNDPRGLWKRQYLQRLGQGLPTRTIIDPVTHNSFTFETPYTQEKLDRWIEQGRIIFPKDIDKYPARKEFLSEYENNQQLVTSLGLYATKATTEQLYVLFDDKKVFTNPKPSTLIHFLFKAVDTKDALILDFFAGSATTAHAVMQLNAEDGGNRKFIMVQWDEPTNEDSEARKAGYETIDQISRERIKRAGAKILKEYNEKQTTNAGKLALTDETDQPKWDKDIGFKHYRLVTPDVKTLDKIETFDPSAPVLIAEDMITPFADKDTDTSGIETLLTTWLIDDGFTFDTPVTAVDIAGYAAHLIHSKLYLIAPDWGSGQTKELLNLIGTNTLNVQHIVVYAYSFIMESLRELEINIKNTLDADHQVYVERRY
ncbi:MAG: site-specific DNA-methyltransferase [Termitinemataceae bacterium]|nr:MAG: site-specific DNA-methyltransferase [Termitinemataceae bacterium]